MRSRRILVFMALLAIVGLAGGGYVLWSLSHDSSSPELVAREYFAAWQDGGLTKMSTLVADPPANFADEHRALSRGLGVTSITLRPGPVVRQGDGRAQADFTVTRTLAPGEWAYPSTLHLARHGGSWKVDWTPATLYPALSAGATWKLTQVTVPAVVPVARDGRALPADSTAQAYVPELADQFGDPGDAEPGWAIELSQIGQAKPQRIKVFGKVKGARLKTTLDRGLQAAADRAVHGASKPAAIVAIRPSTGEVLAVADTLGGRGAFIGRYPPGSSFKVITAGALAADGMGPGTTVGCPGTVTVAQRTIHNHDAVDLGRTTLGQAFAESCNTTFAQLAVERLKAGQFGAQARKFGFGSVIAPGVQAAEGSFPDPQSGAEVAEDAIGQGRVLASPLSMALVAAAVADGTWRPPRLVGAATLRKDVTGGGTPPHAISGTVLAALRPMMRAVVTDGTAASAGLPAGVAGKTGTAEYGSGGESHAWFIGYQGDLAFAAFVEGGGSGPKVAAPLAARFLNAR